MKKNDPNILSPSAEMAASTHQASEQQHVCSEDEMIDEPKWARSIASQLKETREDFHTKWTAWPSLLPALINIH